MARRGTARLFAKHALISLVPVVALGVALVFSLRSEATQRGLAEGRSEATLVAQTAVEPLLDRGPISAPLNARELAGLTRLVDTAVIREKNILRLRIRDLHARVVFSNDNSGKKETAEDGSARSGEGADLRAHHQSQHRQ